MKHLVRHIVCVALALYFALAGCGFNVAHYCCEACAAHGERMFTTGCCDEVHHNHRHHEQTAAHCCEHHHNDGYTAQHNACTLQRLATDISTIAQQHIDCAPTLVLCAMIATPAIAAETPNAHTTFALSHAPPQFCAGRAVLTRIELLLI